MYGKQRLPCHVSLSDEKVITGNSFLPGAGPLSNVPLQKGNFYSVFRASPVSALSQNNSYAKEAYFGVVY